ncbi:hypothetical protein QR680_011733 [Steinernema hermaphroditum]|uniref:Uncharacterized protein n=1 Tax=Steinernema hermaphroditum TaxID=289476 RepID=A0AA39LZH7_9BILA|nr:hypothetical protein QR680_011733 [Steinernema hermaphroditum]
MVTSSSTFSSKHGRIAEKGKTSDALRSRKIVIYRKTNAKVGTRQKNIVRTIHLTAPEPHVKVVLLSKGEAPSLIGAPLWLQSADDRPRGTIAHDASGEEHFEGHQVWEAVINELWEVITAMDQALTYVVEGDQQIVFANSNGDASESLHNPTFYTVETASGEQRAFFRPLRRFRRKWHGKRSCYICLKRLRGAPALTLHLVEYVKARRKCEFCGKKLSFGADNRRRSACRGCARKRVKKDVPSSG